MMDNAVAVPPVIFHEIVAEAPAVMVAGVAVRFSVNGTVTVTVLGADVPPGPVAVSVYVVVAAMGTKDDPEAGSGPVSSG